jgi:integrase
MPAAATNHEKESVTPRIRTRHLSLRTEKAYVHWVRRFILSHHKRHPADLGAPEISQFLTHLAVERRVSASTQTQAALCALLFLYRQLLGREPGTLDGLARARRPRHLPVVLTPDEVKRVLGCLDESDRLVATLLYGTGLRLMEGLRLRVKDIDFSYDQITVRDGKGQKDRVTMLPVSIKAQLDGHLRRLKEAHESDLARGGGRVHLPYALEREYPNAPALAQALLRDPPAGERLRHPHRPGAARPQAPQLGPAAGASSLTALVSTLTAPLQCLRVTVNSTAQGLTGRTAMGYLSLHIARGAGKKHFQLRSYQPSNTRLCVATRRINRCRL